LPPMPALVFLRCLPLLETFGHDRAKRGVSATP